MKPCQRGTRDRSTVPKNKEGWLLRGGDALWKVQGKSRTQRMNKRNL